MSRFYAPRATMSLLELTWLSLYFTISILGCIGSVAGFAFTPTVTLASSRGRDSSEMDSEYQAEPAKTSSTAKLKPPQITPNCSEEQQVFYHDVYSQSWLSKIVVVGTPSEWTVLDNNDYFLRVQVNRILKGSAEDLPLLFNSRNRVPIFVRVSTADQDTFIDQQCTAFRNGVHFAVTTNSSLSVRLGDKYFFFLEKTTDPTMFKPLFSPSERRSSIETNIKRDVLCNPLSSSCENPPKLQAVNEMIVGMVGGSVTLSCRLNNSFQAYFLWSRLDTGKKTPAGRLPSSDFDTDREIVYDMENSYSEATGKLEAMIGNETPFSVLKPSGDRSRLVIEPLGFNHSGVYRCYGKNMFGQSFVNIELLVLSVAEYEKRFPVEVSSSSSSSSSTSMSVVTMTTDRRVSTSKTSMKMTDGNADAGAESGLGVVRIKEPQEDCVKAGLRCINGGICIENLRYDSIECSCPPDFYGEICENRKYSGNPATSRRLVPTTAPIDRAIQPSFSGIQALPTPGFLYVIAGCCILVLAAVISVAVLFMWRMLQRNKRGLQTCANKDNGADLRIFSIQPELAVTSTTNVSLSNTITNTNMCDSACGSTDEDHKSAASHAELYLNNNNHSNGHGNGKGDHGSRAKARKPVNANDVHESYVTPELGSPRSQQSVVSSFYSYPAENFARLPHSRSLHLTPISKSRGADRLRPVQERKGHDRQNVTKHLLAKEPHENGCDPYVHFTRSHSP